MIQTFIWCIGTWCWNWSWYSQIAVWSASLTWWFSSELRTFDVNSRIAFGAIDNGIAYSHIKSFSTSLDVPSINKSGYKRREREIGVAVEAVAANSCDMVLESEIEIEKATGKVPDEDGLLPLAVSYDMQLCYESGIALKCHWDQNFGIPYFYIFEHSLWFLVTMPNFNLLRRLEVAFFGRFFSRFCGRHYWPLFRKLACEWAEVTSEAHLKPSAFTWLLATGK